MKKLFILTAVALLMLNGNNVFAEESPQNTVITNESTDSYVPLRKVFENLGCTVSWDSGSKRAVVSCFGCEKGYFYADSSEVKMIDGVMYVPIQAIEDITDFEFGWDTVNNEAVVAHKAVVENKDLEQITENSSFAEKLNNIMPKDKNYVFSPLSFKYALAMAANGADDVTKEEITKTLGIDNIDDFNDDVKEYIEQMKPEDVEYYDNETLLMGSQLNIANSVWLNSDYIKGGDFSEEFKNKVADKYDADTKTVTNNTAVEEINNWCSEKTNGKIDKIIDSSDFLSCLVNAVYFNAKWDSTFDENMTHKAEFTDRDGNKKQIDFMEQTDKFKFYQDSSIKFIYLPYGDMQTGMYIALTDDNATDFEKYIDKLEIKKVHITMPKFKTEFSTDATPMMNQLGINYAFDKNSQMAHFEPMFNDTVNSEINAYMDKIIQKAYISVDEEGTEAAALTAITLVGSALQLPKPEEIFEFKADKPFTYFIRDNVTGEILFMGEYAYTN